MALQGGTRIGPYQIVESLGAGGMGTVYRAHDSRLGRDVAVKVLSAELATDAALVARFEQEARAAGVLNHPNILSVLDVGAQEHVHFLVSELLEGQTLREALRAGPLPVPKAIGIAIQILHGLAVAHEKGVLHRDLKPENLFLTREGTVKILDFGLAKLCGEGTPASAATEPGTLVGSVGYMSPEQVNGLEVDQRSDVFAFGAVLYEMLSGTRAFKGSSVVAVLNAILHDQPPDLTSLGLAIPPELARVVERCLEKDRARRSQSAHDLAFQLQTLTSAPTPLPAATARKRGTRILRGLLAIGLLAAALGLGWYFLGRGHERPGADPGGSPSIAVLPFVNMGGDKQDEYFSDGMTEEVINALANVEGLRVVARTSAFSFKGRNLNVRQIGKELNVATVLEGSVRREGNQVRIVAQLIDATDGYHLWSKSYNRELKNLFSIEDELARAIVQALKPRLVQSSALAQATTSSTDAHDLYLKGRYFIAQRTKEGLLKAIQTFEQAIALDPAYALAESGLADCYGLLVQHGVRPGEALPKARAHALKAVELDDTLAEAHASMGLLDIVEYEWSAAERDFKRAIELRPGYARAHHWYAMALGAMGRLAEGGLEVERARRLDPTALGINTIKAVFFFDSREYGRAVEQLMKTLELGDWDLTRLWLVHSYLQTGGFSQALAALDAAKHPSNALAAARAEVLAAAGDRAGAQRLLADVEKRFDAEPFQRSTMAAAHLALGDKTGAIAWLEKAVQERDESALDLKSNQMWDSIRSDPGFRSLLHRMNLE